MGKPRGPCRAKVEEPTVAVQEAPWGLRGPNQERCPVVSEGRDVTGLL